MYLLAPVTEHRWGLFMHWRAQGRRIWCEAQRSERALVEVISGAFFYPFTHSALWSIVPSEVQENSVHLSFDEAPVLDPWAFFYAVIALCFPAMNYEHDEEWATGGFKDGTRMPQATPLHMMAAIAGTIEEISPNLPEQSVLRAKNRGSFCGDPRTHCYALP